MATELKTFVEQRAEKAENLSFCIGIKLLHIRKSVEELLSFIGRGNIFEEYTLHNISHIDEMLKIIEWLIPEKTKEIMTSSEWLMLTLAVYFHDLGMLVTKEEYNNRAKTSFKDYKKEILDRDCPIEYKEYAKDEDEHFLYQEFVRENHATRIKRWIEGDSDISLGDGSKVYQEIENMLGHLHRKFRTDLAMICESHHEDDIDDFVKYKVDMLYGNDDEEKVNLDYIAIILRVADLLHITQDRTPSISRRIINVTNPVSVIEWEKQSAVTAVKAQRKRNKDDIVDDSLIKDTIEVTAYFDGAETAEAYFGLSAYLQYARKEIQKCNKIVTLAEKTEGTKDYIFPWTEIDESQVTAVGFEPKKLQFTIAQDNILQLLVGHTLYNDSSVVVRELVQNGIDAVKLQQVNDKQKRKKVTDGVINVCWDEKTRELSFWDNGTGMTITEVENFLLKVGASKYRDEDFKKNYPDFVSISHFGIGILTCFMIANDIDIVTNSEEQKDANIINLRKVNGRYLLRKVEKSNLDDKIKKHGTMVRLHVRPDVDMSSLESNLRKWIVTPEIPVYLSVGDKSVRIGYDNLKDVLVEYLADYGINIDGEKYDVVEVNHGNVSIAYAIRHLRYFSDWCLINVSQLRRRTRKAKWSIGTCIEGIRVEFNTPGYKNSSILAIANIKNSEYQTNVARSAIEIGANKEILQGIYNSYAAYVQKQIENLEKQNYSLAWALSEGQYLMRPLVVTDAHMDRGAEPLDEEALISSLAKLKCLIVENQGSRKAVSAEEVDGMHTVNIIESKMTMAAESLLQEIRTEATLTQLIGVVCSQKNFMEGLENVICNYNSTNILHRYALKNKEVTEINVDRSQRKIHLICSSKQDVWYEFNLRANSKLYIPKGKFEISGLVNEVGVKTVNGTYISSDSELCDYFKRVIDKFLASDDEGNDTLLELFLSYVFNNNMLESLYAADETPNSIIKRMVAESPYRVSEETMNKIWDKIDTTEFADIILRKNYALYSIYDWSRDKTDV